MALVAGLQQAIEEAAPGEAAPVDVEGPEVDYDALFVDDGADPFHVV